MASRPFETHETGDTPQLEAIKDRPPHLPPTGISVRSPSTSAGFALITQERNPIDRARFVR
ncbi:hypothetical protein GCM10027589_53550 [Actinocorallia lasiicapitis]